MIAWGYGIFENTHAMDWLDDLDNYDNTDILYDTLKKATEYLNSGEIDLLNEPYGSGTLVTVELLLAMFNKPSNELPEKALNWINKVAKPSKNILSLALTAIESVEYNSKLKLYWKTNGKDEIWHLLIADLKERLKINSLINTK
ncbi:MAG: DUF4259 domain-containing protein [Clostridiales bacterium]